MAYYKNDDTEFAHEIVGKAIDESEDKTDNLAFTRNDGISKRTPEPFLVDKNDTKHKQFIVDYNVPFKGQTHSPPPNNYFFSQTKGSARIENPFSSRSKEGWSQFENGQFPGNYQNPHPHYVKKNNRYYQQSSMNYLMKYQDYFGYDFNYQQAPNPGAPYSIVKREGSYIPYEEKNWAYMHHKRFVRAVNNGRNNYGDDDRSMKFAKILDELKGNKPNIKKEEVISFAYELSKDQIGSRYIQKMMETCNDKTKDSIFKRLRPHIHVLILDVFGNYVIQKFLEFGMKKHVRELVTAVQGQVIDFSNHKYGCRVIQKVIEVVDPVLRKSIIQELKDQLLKCVNNQNGNHVIQKCIEIFKPKEMDFIVEVFSGNVAEQATRSYGCRVIQRLLEYCSKSQRDILLKEIKDNMKDLMQDQYGNYVVQHVVKNFRSRKDISVVKEMKGRVLDFCFDKFASNVVEVSYEFGTKQDKDAILNELLRDEKGLMELINHRFGNYVVQKIIDLSNAKQRLKIFNALKPNMEKAKRTTFGKHVISKMEKLMNVKTRVK